MGILKQTVNCLLIFLSSLACADELSGVISSDTMLLAGNHTVSGDVTIAQGVTLAFAPVSTVRFNSATGRLYVEGRLQAEGTAFLGAGDGERWGQIIAMPGATVQMEQCHIDMGGGETVPQPYTNAVLLAMGSDVALSHCTITRARGDSMAFYGGRITCVDNVITGAAPTYGSYAGAALYGGSSHVTEWNSSNNVFNAGGKAGVWIDGVFSNALVLAPGSSDIMHFGNVAVVGTSITIPPGTIMSAHNTLPGAITVAEGGVLNCLGTSVQPILWTNYYGANPWPGITWLPGSTGIMSSTIITRALRHTLSNAYVALTSVQMLRLQDGLLMTDQSVLEGDDVVFHGMVNRGVAVNSGSSIRLRQSQFIGNNAPYINSLSADETSEADARFCWWNACSGPRPFGSGDLVATNAGSVFFPWLLAAPDSLTNPPDVQITSPTSEPTVTSDPQAWLEGVVHDDGQIVSVVVQNAASTQRVQVTPDGDGNWRAHIWLYEGMNALAVFAYDEQGNVDVDARLVECSGAGVGAGAARLPVMAPMPNRVVRVGDLVRARCVATSPDACVLTYWAVNVPEGGTFDQELRELQFIPTQAGVAHVIHFYACDGKNVATTTMTVDVVDGDPPVGIRTGALPPGYRNFPYAFTLVADNAAGPVSWSYSDFKAQDGLTYSRAGVISGVPLKEGTVGFTAIAKDTRGDVAASNWFTVSISKDMPTNGVNIPFQQVPVCVSGTAYTALAALIATNGAPEYAWYDASDVLSDIGLAIASNGVISGTPVKAGVHGWLPVVRDQSNGTSYAQLAVPVIAPEHELKRMAGLSKGKLMINRMFGMQTKGNIALKMRFTPPAGFKFDQDSPVVAQVGLTQITVPKAYKYKPGAQLVFKKVDGIKSYSISIKYKPGIVQASFVMKKVNLSLDFEQYGIYNENVLVAKTAKIPVWIRIGDYEMATELMPVQYMTKMNKATKGKAAW